MAAETISPQLDNLSDSSTVVGVDKTREEYLKLFSRASYSPQYDRPYSSPMSGFYNAVNTTTSLLLLNHRVKNSHLREQILPEELTNPSQNEYDYYDYESIIVAQRSKPKKTPLIIDHKCVNIYLKFFFIGNVIHHIFQLILIDILKGQTKFWHNRRCTTSSLVDNLTDVNMPVRSRTSHRSPRRSVSVNLRSQSAILRKDKYSDEPRSFTESFCQYYRDIVEKSKQFEPSLQQYPIKESSNQRIKPSEIRRKVPLTTGQQVYLLGKYHIYDIKDYKVRRSNSYAQALNNRFKADIHCKPQFRLNDPHDYFKCTKVLRAPRSLTPNSSATKRTDTKSQLTNLTSHKSFTINPNKIPITVHIRQEAKSTITIPIQT